MKIFLNYRRADSGYIVDRIFDHLAGHRSVAQVFRDLKFPLGRDFREVITESIKTADVMLAVIGPHWSRIDGREDFVAFEIEAAFELGVSVIPLLVAGASFPDALPPKLEKLRYLHGIAVRPDPDFDGDMTRLIEDLVRQRARSSAPPGLRLEIADSGPFDGIARTILERAGYSARCHADAAGAFSAALSQDSAAVLVRPAFLTSAEAAHGDLRRRSQDLRMRGVALVAITSGEGGTQREGFDATVSRPATPDEIRTIIDPLLLGLQIDSSLERIGGDRELLRELMQFFPEDGPPLLARIEEGYSQRDLQLARANAHWLKGLLANFSNRYGTAVFREIEAACGAESVDRVGELLPEARVVMMRVLRGFRWCNENGLPQR